MTEISIEKIEQDIDNYKKAIENAENALAEAERELHEELERRHGKDLEFIPVQNAQRESSKDGSLLLE